MHILALSLFALNAYANDPVSTPPGVQSKGAPVVAPAPSAAPTPAPAPAPPPKVEKPVGPALVEGKQFTLSEMEAIVADMKALLKNKPGAGQVYGILVDTLSPFWTSAGIGGQIAAAELQVANAFIAPVSRASADLQKSYFKSMVDEGYRGVAMSVLDIEKLAWNLKQARAKLNVISIDSDFPREYRDLFLGTDNFRAGKEAGKAMVKALGTAGGKVIIAVGKKDTPNAAERIRGVREAFKGTTVTVSAVLADGNNRIQADKLVREKLKADKDVQGFVAIYSYNAPVILSALEDHQLAGKVKIVAFDTDEETMKGLKSGEIAATIGQRPYYWGRLAVYILHAMQVAGKAETMKVLAKRLEGPNKDFIDTGIDVITPENLNAYLANLSRK